MRRSSLLLVLFLIGCGGGRPPAPADDRAPSLLDVWSGLDEAFAGLAGREQEACYTSLATWFADFGSRGLACAAVQVIAPTALVARAPVAPFLRGPHTARADVVRFDLNAPRDFGHYAPAFVRWFMENAIPDGEVTQSLTQPIYDRRVRRLARIYWLTVSDLERQGFPESLPVGPFADYVAFLDGGAAQDSEYYGSGEGFSVFAFTDRSESLIPRVGLVIENDWTVKYEANTAYGFWLRRHADGTRMLWHDGLRQLLQTYDAAWLADGG